MLPLTVQFQISCHADAVSISSPQISNINYEIFTSQYSLIVKSFVFLRSTLFCTNCQENFQYISLPWLRNLLFQKLRFYRTTALILYKMNGFSIHIINPTNWNVCKGWQPWIYSTLNTMTEVKWTLKSFKLFIRCSTVATDRVATGKLVATL
jgi:hypothetical protein